MIEMPRNRAAATDDEPDHLAGRVDERAFSLRASDTPRSIWRAVSVFIPVRLAVACIERNSRGEDSRVATYSLTLVELVTASA